MRMLGIYRMIMGMIAALSTSVLWTTATIFSFLASCCRIRFRGTVFMQTAAISQKGVPFSYARFSTSAGGISYYAAKV